MQETIKALMAHLLRRAGFGATFQELEVDRGKVTLPRHTGSTTLSTTKGFKEAPETCCLSPFLVYCLVYCSTTPKLWDVPCH